MLFTTTTTTTTTPAAPAPTTPMAAEAWAIAQSWKLKGNTLWADEWAEKAAHYEELGW